MCCAMSGLTIPDTSGGEPLENKVLDDELWELDEKSFDKDLRVGN